MTRNRSWLSVIASFGLSCCASSVEGIGSYPAPPCHYGAAFVVGTIEEVGGGCVSVRIERVVAEGVSVDSPKLEPGSLVRGHLGSTYAYTHEFSVDEHIAVFIMTHGEELALQLFPYENGRVQAQWATASLSLSLEEMSSDECPQQLEARRRALPAMASNRPRSGETSPPPHEVSCTLP